jgi:hypothetical protein
MSDSDDEDGMEGNEDGMEGVLSLNSLVMSREKDPFEDLRLAQGEAKRQTQCEGVYCTRDERGSYIVVPYSNKNPPKEQPRELLGKRIEYVVSQPIDA